MHDRAVAPGQIALQFINVAERASPPRDYRFDFGLVIGDEIERGYRRVVADMRTVAGADDHGGGARLVENPSAGDRRDIRPVAIRDAPQRPQQLLKQTPAAEIVDDQLVFDERAVFERRRRLQGAEPTIAEEAAGHRAVAEQPDAAFGAERGEAARRPLVEHGILHLHARYLRARGEDIAQVRRIEIGEAEKPDLAGAPHLVQRANRVDQAGRRI